MIESHQPNNKLTKEDSEAPEIRKKVNTIINQKRARDDCSMAKLNCENANKKQKLSMSHEETRKNVQHTLAWQWANIMKDGLLDNIKKELLVEYSPIGEYNLLGPPILNSSLKFILNKTLMKADQSNVNIQEQITSALVGIGKIITSILTCHDSRLIDVDILIDVAMLLGNVHHEISLQRRSAIISAFDLQGLTDASEVNETLFGKKLLNIIKSAKVLEEQNNQPSVDGVECPKNSEVGTKSVEVQTVGCDQNCLPTADITNKDSQKTENNGTEEEKNSQKSVDVSKSAEESKDPVEKNLGGKAASNVRPSPEIPGEEKKDSENKEINSSTIKQNSQESVDEVECSKKNETGTKSPGAQTASNPQNCLSTAEVKASVHEGKSSEETSDPIGKNLEGTAVGNVQESSKTPSKENKYSSEKNTEETIMLDVKNASLRVIEEFDVAFKKKIESLQMDDLCVKQEKEAAKRSGPQQDFPGFQEAYRLKYLLEGHCERAAEMMSYGLAKSTMQSYQRPLRFWWEFCKKHNIDVFQGSEQNVTQFFVEYDNLITSSNVLGTWRSALGRFTTIDLGKSTTIADYVNGYKSLRGEKHEKK